MVIHHYHKSYLWRFTPSRDNNLHLHETSEVQSASNEDGDSQQRSASSGFEGHLHYGDKNPPLPHDTTSSETGIGLDQFIRLTLADLRKENIRTLLREIREG